MNHRTSGLLSIVIAIALFAFACGDSAGSNENGLTSGPGSDEPCPEGEVRHTMVRYFTEQDCVVRNVFFGCVDKDELQTTDIKCATSAEGTFLGSSSLLTPPTYTACDAALNEAARAAPECSN